MTDAAKLTCVAMTAIIGLVFLDYIAIKQGLNGTLMSTTFAAIGTVFGGLVGYFVKAYKNKVDDDG